MRGESLNRIVSNYAALQETFEESKNAVTDTELKARIIGVSSQMTTFSFLFGCRLGGLILNHSDNLNQTLQQVNLSATEGQAVANLTVQTLQSLRSDSMFDFFWRNVLQTKENLDVDDPTLPRRRKTPRRLETGNGEPSFPDSPKDLYRQVYFEAIDLVVNAIKARFNQPGFQVYRNLEELLLTFKLQVRKPLIGLLLLVIHFMLGK